MPLKRLSDFQKRRRVRRFADSHRRTRERGVVRHHRPNPETLARTPQTPTRQLPEWVRGDLGAGIGIALLLCIGVYAFVIRNERFVITEVQIDGVEYLDYGTIDRTAQDYLRSRWLGLVSRNTYWTVRHSTMEQRIEAAFADSYALNSVEVEVRWPNTMQIHVTERVPSLAWVTREPDGREHFYTIDRQGIVTEELPTFDQVNPAFPRVRDDNRPSLGLGWQVISADYLGVIFQLHDQFEAVTGLPVDSFVFPETSCQERQYVAEKIFQQEILESESEEFRDRRVEIQERFQNGELTIDQSLEELERVKEEELLKLGEDSEDGFERLEWETVYVETDCDYVVVASDIWVLIPDTAGGFTVRMDARGDIAVQLENLITVLAQKVEDRDAIQYIDVRIPDRVYMK